MRLISAALAVLFCPLVGAIVWMTQTIIQSVQLERLLGGKSLWESAKEDPTGMVSLVGIGWLYGLVLTVFVGLPLGSAIAYLIRRLGGEGLLAYAAAGAVTAFAFSMVLPSRSEFWLPITVTGLLMGLSYWLLVRKPVLAAADRP